MSEHTVRLFGEVTRAGMHFGMKDTEVELLPFGRDLVPFGGKRVIVTGREMGLSSPPIVTVLDVDPCDEFFHFGGDDHLGGTLTLNIENADAEIFFLFLGFQAGYLPLDGLADGVEGTLFLDPSLIITTHDGPLVDGDWHQSVWIPTSAEMVGLQVFMQPAVVPRNGLLRYLNVDSMTVRI